MLDSKNVTIVHSLFQLLTLVTSTKLCNFSVSVSQDQEVSQTVAQVHSYAM